MKKKLLSVLLCLSLVCTPFVAFAEEESETENETEAVMETETVDGAEFEETTVIDDSDCIVRITSIEPDSEYGYVLKAYFENNSDMDLYFVISDASLNGVMCDPYFGIEVAAGKKANSEIEFYSFSYITEDIGEISNIEFTFYVYDNDTWDEITSGTANIFPSGEDNSTLFERDALETDTILLDNEDATFIVIGSGSDDMGYTVNLFIVNKADSRVYFTAEDVSVNGYMLDPYWGAELPAGKCMYSSMTWYDEDLEENDIEEVTDVEFSLMVYDYETWDEYANETVTYEP